MPDAAAADASSPNRRAEQVLERLAHVPPLPDASLRLLTEAGDDAACRDAVAAVEADASLAPRVLALAKLFSGARAKDITALDDVTMLCGVSPLRAAVVAAQFYDLFAERPALSLEAADAGGAPRCFHRRRFWLATFAAATAAELTAQARTDAGQQVDPADAFIAALLHGLGVIALDALLPTSFDRVAEFAEREGKDLAEIERGLVGINHHTVGRKLAEKWNLPQHVRDAIWLAGVAPSRVPDTPTKPIVTTVNLGVAIARFAQLAWFGDAPLRADVESVAKTCGLQPQWVTQLEASIFEATAQRLAAAGVNNATIGELYALALRRSKHELDRQRTREGPREKLVEKQRLALAEIESFQSQSSGSNNSVAAATALLRSVERTLGSAWTAIAIQRPGSATVRLYSATHDAPEATESSAECPPGQRGLRDVQFNKNAGALAIALPWLARADALQSASSAAFVTPLPTGDDACAILLTDNDPGLGGPSAASTRALLGVWASAVGLLAAQDARRAADERLAAADSKLEEARRKLLEADGLKTIAELAKGATRGFKQQAEMIRTRCEMLKGQIERQRDQRFIEAIDDAGSKIATLVDTMKLFGEAPESHPAPVSLNWLLERAARDARQIYKPDPKRYPQPRPRVVAEENLPPVLIDSEQALEALREIIINGLESETSEIVEVRGHVDSATGRALILIRDDGQGMSPEDLPHACDPYFTGNKKARKLGLGLTRAKRFIECNGGELTLRADPGGGLAVAVFLPLAPEHAEAQTPEDAAQAEA